MKPSISRTKARKALVELRAAATHLGDVRPCTAIEPEEFLELCRIKQDLEELVKRFDEVLKGGAL
ncbi:MAG: hypothetical protein IKR05_08320 [Prevotella sp.]|nr:hypothetical protein [Prevotella sp.]